MLMKKMMFGLALMMAMPALASHTVRNPMYQDPRSYNHEKQRISCNSDKEAVCVYLGYQRAVSAQCVSKKVSQLSAQMDQALDCTVQSLVGGNLCGMLHGDSVEFAAVFKSDSVAPFFHLDQEWSDSKLEVIKTISCE